MLENLDVQALIQGGAVAISLGLLIILFYKNKNDALKDAQINKIITNHLEHDLESRDKNTQVMQRLIDMVDRFGDLIKNK